MTFLPNRLLIAWTKCRQPLSASKTARTRRPERLHHQVGLE